MNNEVIKAMNRKEKKHTFRKWWSNNGYKVLRVIFFPIWIAGIIEEKTKKYLNGRQVWSEKRANEILNYYVPRKSDWDEEDKTFYFFDNGYGWGKLANRYLKRKDRRFFQVNKYKLRWYLIDDFGFELEGFEKKEGDCSGGWTELEFVMKEGAEQ